MVLITTVTLFMPVSAVGANFQELCTNYNQRLESMLQKTTAAREETEKKYVRIKEILGFLQQDPAFQTNSDYQGLVQKYTELLTRYQQLSKSLNQRLLKMDHCGENLGANDTVSADRGELYGSLLQIKAEIKVLLVEKILPQAKQAVI